MVLRQNPQTFDILREDRGAFDINNIYIQPIAMEVWIQSVERGVVH